MQLFTVLLNALLASSGVATALPKDAAATTKLVDISPMGEVSKTPRDSSNSGLEKRAISFGLCLGHASLPSRKVKQYKSDVRLVFDQIAQWDPSHSYVVQAGNKWTWTGPTSGGNRRVQITDNCRAGAFSAGDLQQFLAQVLRDCDSTRSGWAYVSTSPVIVAIVHDITIPPPSAHLTCG
ncbi:hypothetical protein FBEOM_8143 [Fusarium beomiforme]|uniref:Ecp2 effector protein domain-containing protein n=1 Tax=Fusarium beomiforme TaxID=44412 RepID=A0A9P5AG66_9HYPO|nr:hypothetical protein FBEOM_8143 [Fusarium beomiforme]